MTIARYAAVAMRLLLINPNTTASMTEMVVETARGLVALGTEVVGVTARFGAAVIVDRVSYAIGARAALDAWAEAPGPFDAVVLACFGDPGLEALRELAPVPVVGMAEASIQAACRLGGRFGIVTGGSGWAPILREFVAIRGLTNRLACIHTLAPTGADIARDPEGSLPALAAACAQAANDGADAVILGGAGLAGLAERLARCVPVPLIDGLVAAIAQAETLARLPQA